MHKPLSYEELEKKYEELGKQSGLTFRKLAVTAPPPDIVVDVGANNGTGSLYRAFPQAKFYLIDALEQNRAALAAFTQQYDAEIIISGVGARAETLSINVAGNEHGSRSSFLKRSGRFADDPVAPQIVKVERLDRLIAPSAGTIGLKLDVEGFELRVLEGATGLMPQIQWVLAEASITRRFENDPMFEGLNAFLTARGFTFRDIAAIKRNLEGDLRYIDALFVRNELVDYPRTRRR